MKNEAEIIEKIESMTREDMCYAYRFSVAGNPIFDTTKPFYEIFMKRFKELGVFLQKYLKKLGGNNETLYIILGSFGGFRFCGIS